MGTAVTHGILVTARARFEPAHSDPKAARHIFSYRISIRNTGDGTVQLLRRHWFIRDVLDDPREVEGPGVVGETPVLVAGRRSERTRSQDHRSRRRRQARRRRGASRSARRVVAHRCPCRGQAGGFDQIERHLAANEDSVIRGALMGALGNTRDPALLQRALKLGLGPSVKSGEMIRLYFGATEQPENHAAIWAFVQENYDALLNKLPSVWQGKIAFFGSAALCSAAGANELQAFLADRVKDLEGGPRALAQGVEGVTLCTARVAKHQQH